MRASACMRNERTLFHDDGCGDAGKINVMVKMFITISDSLENINKELK